MVRYDALYDKDSPVTNWAGFVSLFFFIVIVLFSMFWPRYCGGTASGRYTSCHSNLINIGTALKMYADENDGCYPVRLEMLTPEYMRIIPTCPSILLKFYNFMKKRLKYTDTYQVSDDFRRFTFYCGSREHHYSGVRDNYPQYNSTEELINH